jgi:hypothetical protein
MVENTPVASTWRYDFVVAIYAGPHDRYFLGATRAPWAGLARGGREAAAHFC